jgi:hypothetical protein
MGSWSLGARAKSALACTMRASTTLAARAPLVSTWSTISAFP